MQEIFNSNIMILVAAGISLISLIIAVVAIISYGRIARKYNSFMLGRNAESLESLIYKLIERIDRLEDEDVSNKEAMRTMNRHVRASIQKSGIVHYDAFEGMGGKMSFACALLDDTNSGIVMNCMHGREGCFMYIKEVESGATDMPLGAEEKEALERALGYIQ